MNENLKSTKLWFGVFIVIAVIILGICNVKNLIEIGAIAGGIYLTYCGANSAQKFAETRNEQGPAPAGPVNLP